MGWLIFLGSVLKGSLLLFSYLNNLTFPQPLDEAGERECLKRLKAGDEEAKNILIERNLRLVAHVIKNMKAPAKMGRPDLHWNYRTYQGNQHFDESRGTRLATYAARCIENEVQCQYTKTAFGLRELGV